MLSKSLLRAAPRRRLAGRLEELLQDGAGALDLGMLASQGVDFDQQSRELNPVYLAPVARPAARDKHPQVGDHA
jgi:hypothetical protein